MKTREISCLLIPYLISVPMWDILLCSCHQTRELKIAAMNVPQPQITNYLKCCDIFKVTWSYCSHVWSLYNCDSTITVLTFPFWLSLEITVAVSLLCKISIVSKSFNFSKCNLGLEFKRDMQIILSVKCYNWKIMLQFQYLFPCESLQIYTCTHVIIIK